MFYRRKLILALFEAFGGKLAKIDLQKLLFLVTNKQNTPSYDFIPYKYGSFSYSAYADLSAMVKHGFLLEDDNNFEKKDKLSYLSSLNASDRKLVNQVYILFNKYNADALMKHTYVNFPYYAINSVTAERLLTQDEIAKVKAAKPVSNETILFTIGYEGTSVEAYLNKLIKNDVKVLVDVRSNPISQKYGFSKTLLQRHCNSLNIDYVHFAQVGIKSDERQQLNSQKDYDVLFDGYKQTTLAKTIETQQEILNLLIEKQRIALTCYEANICQCHRKHLGEAITQLKGWNYSLKHI